MEEQIIGADSAPAAAAPRQLDAQTASVLEPDGLTGGASHESANTSDAATLSTASYSWIEWIRQGLRAGTLRPVQGLPEGPGAWPMLLLMAAMTVIVSGASRLEVDGPASFDLRAWLFGWAPAALLVFGVWLVLHWAREKTTHASPVAAWYLLFSVATLPLSLIGVALSVLSLRGYMPQWWSQDSWFAWAIYAALWVWLVITTLRVSQAVTRSTHVAVSLATYVLVVQIVATWQLRTQEWQPVESNDDDEFVSLELSQDVFESQQALLKNLLQAITPSTGSERQTYGLVYAPYSEDVFLRESAMVQQVLEERFGARGRVVRLVNNSTTAAELPWATTLNLQRSLRALAEAMDTERDVLVVYLTSHGGADFKLASENWPLEVEDLTAGQLRAMLDELGIRHRVIAVSACYAGGWIEPLQNEDTLIMTAADKDHTSYGCGSKSELTFFGRAVFDEQLRKTLSFEKAFNAAVPVIKQREIEGKK
ncbi:MAG TPA: C13 family peptidase, partial [Steroidobacter sp.]|nr:C13 family peptidase [Steroidobacter sp.]